MTRHLFIAVALLTLCAARHPAKSDEPASPNERVGKRAVGLALPGDQNLPEYIGPDSMVDLVFTTNELTPSVTIIANLRVLATSRGLGHIGLTVEATPTEAMNLNLAARKGTLRVRIHVKPGDEQALVKFLRALPTEETDRSIVDRLVEQFGDDDFGKREAATERVIAKGSRRIKYSILFATSGPGPKDPEVVARANQCLEAIDERERRIKQAFDVLVEQKCVRELSSLAAADSLDVRRMAPAAIARIAQQESDEAIDALIAALKVKDTDPLAENELNVPAQAAWCLGVQLTLKGKAAISDLIEAAKSPDSLLAGQAIRALGYLCRGKCERQAEAVKVAIALLEDKNRGEARMWAANALAALGPAGKESVPVLLEVLKEPKKVNLQANCMQALENLAPDDANVIDALANVLQSNTTIDDREFAANCLKRIGPPARRALPTLRNLIPKNTDTKDDQILAGAIRGAIDSIEKKEQK